MKRAVWAERLCASISGAGARSGSRKSSQGAPGLAWMGDDGVDQPALLYRPRVLVPGQLPSSGDGNCGIELQVAGGLSRSEFTRELQDRDSL